MTVEIKGSKLAVLSSVLRAASAPDAKPSGATPQATARSNTGQSRFEMTWADVYRHQQQGGPRSITARGVPTKGAVGERAQAFMDLATDLDAQSLKVEQLQQAKGPPEAVAAAVARLRELVGAVESVVPKHLAALRQTLSDRGITGDQALVAEARIAAQLVVHLDRRQTRLS